MIPHRSVVLLIPAELSLPRREPPTGTLIRRPTSLPPRDRDYSSPSPSLAIDKRFSATGEEEGGRWRSRFVGAAGGVSRKGEARSVAAAAAVGQAGTPVSQTAHSTNGTMLLAEGINCASSFINGSLGTISKQPEQNNRLARHESLGICCAEAFFFPKEKDKRFVQLL